MISYLEEFFTKHGISHYTDQYGNVYATKGSAEVYPCVVAHTDTVHKLNSINVLENDQGDLYAVDQHGLPTGIGGDNKAGVFVCLEMFKQLDVVKGAFFVGEEVGCLGSFLSDATFFENVGYIMQFDAPFADWISWYSDGVQLFEVEGDFFKKIEPVFEQYMPGYTRKKCLYPNHPFTDVSALKRLYPVSCINYSVGYYQMHSPYERVSIADVSNTVRMAKLMIENLGCNKYPYTSKYIVTEGVKLLKERRLRALQVPLTD